MLGGLLFTEYYSVAAKGVTSERIDAITATVISDMLITSF